MAPVEAHVPVRGHEMHMIPSRTRTPARCTSRSRSKHVLHIYTRPRFSDDSLRCRVYGTSTMAFLKARLRSKASIYRGRSLHRLRAIQHPVHDSNQFVSVLRKTETESYDDQQQQA